MAVCRIKEKNPLIKCSRDAWGEDPEGLCLLHSENVNKYQDDNFTNSVNQQLKEKDYNFRRAFFASFVNFIGKEFTNKADFSRATFSGIAYFNGVDFFSLADFHSAIFSDVVAFNKATFSFLSDFSWAKFSDEAIFNGATFSENAYFLGVNILATGRMVFRSINSSEKKNQRVPFQADFRLLQQEPGSSLLFQDLSLDLAQFTGTDLRKVEFNNVTWGRKYWRAAVYDEILLHQRRWAYISYSLNYGWLWGKRIPGEVEERIPKKPSYEDFAPVERLYRQLKANYEEERDFKRLGDFHYGEMEMHRRGSPWRQWLPSWYNFYRVLSGYGERPLRAFIWLLLLIPAWAGLVWGLGINQADSLNPVNYWDTLLFIFDKVTFQRPELPKGITWLGKFLSSLSVLLLPGQAALFILALRNRLGRRR